MILRSGRTTVRRRIHWAFVGILFSLGSGLIGQGLWIPVKATAAQRLLQHAWQETLITQQPVKPWPWADTWPVGRLFVPRLNINHIILADASGQSLAFGPGNLVSGNFLDDHSQSLILSGHRDTHFSFVRDVQHGDTIKVQTIQGEWTSFVVENTEVVDSRNKRLTTNQEEASLLLVTCYPFNALFPGGPLRYVVTARPVALTDIPPIAASSMPGSKS